jgi:uncharacterized membrane protein YphA (DoxX/SURF4 family)
VTGFGFVCAVVLAAVFVWAAAAKFARPAVTAAGFRTLGLPVPGGLAWAVPAAEVVTAVLLVAVPPVGGVVALVLLGAFSAVIARALRLGLTTPCGCFGATSAKPVSRADLVRNLLLACLALAALVAAS